METTEAVSQNVKQSDHDCNLERRAHDAFTRENYDKCLELLDQLEASRGLSNVITHNRVVAKFYKSGCKDYQELLAVLNQLDGEGASNMTVMYNQAVIHFHRHVHHSAVKILDKLYQNVNKMDENMTGLVGILYLRLMIANNQVCKTAAFVEVLQKQLGLKIDTTVSSDEASSSEVYGSMDGFTRTFKLLTLLVHTMNRKSVVIPDDGTAEMAALKAHQYYIMKDFQMAAKQLNKINQITDGLNGANSDELSTCIANNMGVIHLRVRHYAIAAKFFQNAISFEKNIALGIKSTPLQHMSSVRSIEILYNLGIAMLHLRRPNEAFQCFLVPLKTYHNNPRLWLRIAEACIMEHEMKSIEMDKKPMMKGTIQIGSRKHYVIKPSPRVMYSGNESAAVTEPTLEFAVLCLRNALTLTYLFRTACSQTAAEEEKQREDVTNWRTIKDNNFCNPSTPISKESIDNLLLGIFAAYSYVSLRIGDYTTALEMAQELLKADNLTDAHKLLAHMYAGEALIMMDKLPEARPHLDPTFVTSLNAFDFETKDWQVKSLDAAQNIVRYNLAVAMVLQGDLEMARNLLNSCKHPIVVHKLKSLRVYLNLRTGNYT